MSRGRYKGLEEIGYAMPGQRVTILLECTVEAVQTIERTGDDGVVHYGGELTFGGGYVLEFPTEQDGRKHGVQMTVREKR